MILSILFDRYSRSTLKCLKRIVLSNLNKMIIMTYHVLIDVETLRIDNMRYLEKEFIKLICINP